MTVSPSSKSRLSLLRLAASPQPVPNALQTHTHLPTVSVHELSGDWAPTHRLQSKHGKRRQHTHSATRIVVTRRPMQAHRSHQQSASNLRAASAAAHCLPILEPTAALFPHNTLPEMAPQTGFPVQPRCTTPPPHRSLPS